MELTLGPIKSESKGSVPFPLAPQEQEVGDNFKDLLAEAGVAEDLPTPVAGDQEENDPLKLSKLASQVAAQEALISEDQPAGVLGEILGQERLSQQELNGLEGSLSPAKATSRPSTKDIDPKILTTGPHGDTVEETSGGDSVPVAQRLQPKTEEIPPEQTAAEQIQLARPKAVPKDSKPGSDVKLKVPSEPKENPIAAGPPPSESAKSGENIKVAASASATESAGRLDETLPDSNSFSHQGGGNSDLGQQQPPQAKSASLPIDTPFNLDVTSTSTAGGAQPASQPTTFEREGISTENLIQQVKLNVRTGTSRISFMVDPPELGRLNIQLTMRNGRLTGVLEAESKDVERALLRGLESLKETMRAAGIHVDSLDVKSSLNQLANDSWQAATNEGRGESFSQRRDRQDFAAEKDINAEKSAESKIETVETGESLINIIA